MVAVLLGIGACGFQVDLQPPDAPAIPDAPPGAWVAGYSYRKPIVVTRAGSSVLASFPVGIVLASDANLAAHARSDGRDIVVTSGDAMTRLDSELASFDASSGRLEIWTRVPSLPPATSTILYLYYGGPASTTNATGVWPATRFKGVWHLSEPSSIAAAADSTAAGHTLGTTGTAIPTHEPGIAGLARGHDGIDDELQIGDPADGSLDVGMQSFAVSMWINSAGAVGSFDNPLFKGGTSPGSPGYCVITGMQNPWLGKLHDGTNYLELALAPPTNGQWVHVAIVVDRVASPARSLGYINGVQTDQQNLTLGSLDTQRELSIGAGSGSPYRGLVDEARIYNTALTAEWIATEYANLATPGFITKGAEEPMP